ncbi:hypothetical protein [Citrobacter portucalensis]|uniref:hypothetical protein n=1 Tax=Citrobacter portucalensis TaxID=1639133 RepID=UPI00214DE4B9|nr:hypothetical protein [Citrobacter portucalensis]
MQDEQIQNSSSDDYSVNGRTVLDSGINLWDASFFGSVVEIDLKLIKHNITLAVMRRRGIDIRMSGILIAVYFYELRFEPKLII